MICPKCNNPNAECIIGNYYKCSVCDNPTTSKYTEGTRVKRPFVEDTAANVFKITNGEICPSLFEGPVKITIDGETYDVKDGYCTPVDIFGEKLVFEWVIPTVEEKVGLIAEELRKGFKPVTNTPETREAIKDRLNEQLNKMIEEMYKLLDKWSVK